jgi:hypothetical protein
LIEYFGYFFKFGLVLTIPSIRYNIIIANYFKKINMSFCCFLIEYSIIFRAKYPQRLSFSSLFAHAEGKKQEAQKTARAYPDNTKGGQKHP